ncbi:MAG: MATE family efflux transporter, partial [Planctomycetota bacterium]|jgi:MATE family multidrug resistance protein|nr:MATE family efflux transporter [Planctomycetota bacterium]
MIFIGLCFVIFREQLSNMFIKNDDPVEFAKAIELSKGVLIAAAVWQIGDAIQIAYRFALRAAGDHVWVMWAGILCTWILSMPVAWVVVFVFNGDVADVWMAWNAEIFASSLFFVMRWRSGKWAQKRLVED